jgi:hypothetical protein
MRVELYSTDWFKDTFTNKASLWLRTGLCKLRKLSGKNLWRALEWIFRSALRQANTLWPLIELLLSVCVTRQVQQHMCVLPRRPSPDLDPRLSQRSSLSLCPPWTICQLVKLAACPSRPPPCIFYLCGYMCLRVKPPRIPYLLYFSPACLPACLWCVSASLCPYTRIPYCIQKRFWTRNKDSENDLFWEKWLNIVQCKYM